MATEKEVKRDRLYLGVDVGGTKVLAAVVEESGMIVDRRRCPTPRTCGPEEVVASIEQIMEDLLRESGVEFTDLTAIGVAIPGVVDPDQGRVVVTPNMSLTGVELSTHLEGRFGVPVALGNDCNLGAVGETWLGSARAARSAVGIFVGTGIGAGLVQQGKLWRGARESASEIGHIIMQIDGPVCGCGNRGCLEALASRTAIERDIRQAVAEGRTTVLTEILEGKLDLIRSSAIRQSLDRKDELVTEVVRRASEVLGYACLTVRHLVDPEVIVLGGGVVEACSDFILPIVENVVGSDQLPGARDGGRVLLSALGDDAVVLGAVALARRHVGRSPFKRRFFVTPTYPKIVGSKLGEITVGRKTYTQDITIRVNGRIKKRKPAPGEDADAVRSIGARELEKACKGGPEVLFIGTGQSEPLEIAEEAHQFLQRRAIHCEALPTPEAIKAYNDSTRRKAALLHVTG